MQKENLLLIIYFHKPVPAQTGQIVARFVQGFRS